MGTALRFIAGLGVFGRYRDLQSVSFCSCSRPFFIASPSEFQSLAIFAASSAKPPFSSESRGEARLGKMRIELALSLRDAPSSRNVSKSLM